MLRRHLLTAALAAPLILRTHAARATEAVDASRSVDQEEQEMLFKGYAAAFRDRRPARWWNAPSVTA